jgi:hypothetical protein
VIGTVLLRLSSPPTYRFLQATNGNAFAPEVALNGAERRPIIEAFTLGASP